MTKHFIGGCHKRFRTHHSYFIIISLHSPTKYKGHGDLGCWANKSGPSAMSIVYKQHSIDMANYLCLPGYSVFQHKFSSKMFQRAL